MKIKARLEIRESLSKLNRLLTYPVVGSHIHRIGIFRTVAGGLSMYSFMPILILVHFLLVLIFFQWIVSAVVGNTRLRQRDFLILDRHRIHGIALVDKLNCLYCDYANGLCTLINKELDQLQLLGDRQIKKRITFQVFVVMIMLPIGVIFEIGFQLIYNMLVSRIMGMHRVSMREARLLLDRYPYDNDFPASTGKILLFLKNSFLRFSMALEQIESSWCPLRHYPAKEGIVYPTHHRRFFGPDEIEEMRKVLSSVGTVSEKKPTW